MPPPETPLPDSRDVAAYIAQQCEAKGIAYNNTKIQKLLYCAYGIMLAAQGRRICDEYPRAWTYGPVFPKVFKWIYKGHDIAGYSAKIEQSEDALTKAVVARVLDFFGQYAASDLSAWTHRPGSPWWRVIRQEQGPWNSFMPDEYIREYFAEQVLAKS